MFEFAWILDFLCPLKVALEVLHDRVLGSLGRQMLMTSTQERNTMAPQCSRKWKAKLIVPIYFGTKTSKLCLRIFFLFITGVRVKFRFERLRNKLRSSAFGNSVRNHCLELWEQFAIIQATTGKTSLRTSCLYIGNGKLDTKWRSRNTKSRKEKSRTALDGKFDT